MTPAQLDSLEQLANAPEATDDEKWFVPILQIRELVRRARELADLRAAAAEALAWGEEAVRAGCRDPETGEPDENLARHAARNHTVLVALRKALGKEADHA